jgi:hypothetical protein
MGTFGALGAARDQPGNAVIWNSPREIPTGFQSARLIASIIVIPSDTRMGNATRILEIA